MTIHYLIKFTRNCFGSTPTTICMILSSLSCEKRARNTKKYRCRANSRSGPIVHCERVLVPMLHFFLRPIPPEPDYDSLTKFCKYNLKAPTRTISCGVKLSFTYYINKLHSPHYILNCN